MIEERAQEKKEEIVKKLISLLDLTTEELNSILDRADKLELCWNENQMPQCLKDKQIGLWFYGQGFRNRLAFEIGARAMGASVSYIPGELGVHEPLEDIGPYLQNWFSMLVVRCKRQKDINDLSRSISIPIINARTEIGHPCEILSDLQYVRKHRGTLDGLKAVFVGEVTNLGMSWLEASNRFPISVTHVSPKKYQADDEIINRLRINAKGQIEQSEDLLESISIADLIYTDCWPKSDSEEERKQIDADFRPYQITNEVLSQARPDTIFLPCPPVTRGQEVSEDAMKSPLCMNFEAKKYLLHCQNAIMEYVMN
jgi:ornithine carbamoyltransferase